MPTSTRLSCRHATTSAIGSAFDIFGRLDHQAARDERILTRGEHSSEPVERSIGV